MIPPLPHTTHDAPVVRTIVFDLETTGLSNATDRIVSIGCVELIGEEPTGIEWEQLINPQRSVPAEATKIHGLTNADLANQPPFSAIATKLTKWLNQTRLVIHNAPFDLGFLYAELKRAAHKTDWLGALECVDTLALSRQSLPKLGRYSLDRLCDHFEIDRTDRSDGHGALLDCRLLAKVYKHLCGGPQRKLFEQHRTPRPNRAILRVAELMEKKTEHPSRGPHTQHQQVPSPAVSSMRWTPWASSQRPVRQLAHNEELAQHQAMRQRFCWPHLDDSRKETTKGTPPTAQPRRES